jgi:hypothetical protein
MQNGDNELFKVSIVRLGYCITDELSGAWGSLFNGELGYGLCIGMTPYEAGG